MSLRALRTLQAIARHGSFAAAGKAVGLTQSAVSLQVKVLLHTDVVKHLTLTHHSQARQTRFKLPRLLSRRAVGRYARAASGHAPQTCHTHAVVHHGHDAITAAYRYSYCRSRYLSE